MALRIGGLIEWAWCTPEIALGILGAVIVGAIGWFIGEQAGWEEGYWQGLDERNERDEDEYLED